MKIASVRADCQRITICFDHHRIILTESDYTWEASHAWSTIANGSRYLRRRGTDYRWRWTRQSTLLARRRTFKYAFISSVRQDMDNSLHARPSPVALIAIEQAMYTLFRHDTSRRVEKTPDQRVIPACLCMPMVRGFTTLTRPVKQSLLIWPIIIRKWLPLRYLPRTAWQMSPSWILLAST